MLSYKYRLHPSKDAEAILTEHLELCRWLYNRLLEELTRARSKGRKLRQRDTQALTVRLKEEHPELKQVYPRVLQIVNYQLWSNIRALSRLKRNGKKIGKLRFKGKSRYKNPELQSVGGSSWKGRSLCSLKSGR